MKTRFKLTTNTMLMKSTTNVMVIFFYHYDYLNLHDADADERHVEKQNTDRHPMTPHRWWTTHRHSQGWQGWWRLLPRCSFVSFYYLSMDYILVLIYFIVWYLKGWLGWGWPKCLCISFSYYLISYIDNILILLLGISKDELKDESINDDKDSFNGVFLFITSYLISIFLYCVS